MGLAWLGWVARAEEWEVWWRGLWSRYPPNRPTSPLRQPESRLIQNSSQMRPKCSHCTWRCMNLARMLETKKPWVKL